MPGIRLRRPVTDQGTAHRMGRRLVCGFASVALLALTVGVSLAQAPSASAAEAHHAVARVAHPHAGGGTTLTPPFNECPSIGQDTTCGLLIVLTSTGERILQDPTQGPYDGADDTLIGVVNQSGAAVPSIQLSSGSDPIFGFEGDGICTFAPFPGSGYCATLPPTATGYEGPDNTFTNISPDTMSGTVSFTAPLANNGSTYFSLETGPNGGLSSCSFVGQCGYWEAASDGGIFAFGAPFLGSMGGRPLNLPVVGITANPVTGGYWEVAQDGGLFAFGAPFYGSEGGQPLNQPIVAMASTPDGGGYWEVAKDGGVFAFGDAKFFGSMGGKPLNAPVVGIAATLDGQGYFEVGADGGLFAFGDAVFHGSEGGQPLNQPVVGMATDPSNGGYWEVAKDGGLFAFGGAPFFGSEGGQPLNAPVVGMASTPDGGGYFEAATDGGMFAFGDAVFLGSMGGQPLNAPIVGIASLI